jgi:hypothetical protein
MHRANTERQSGESGCGNTVGAEAMLRRATAASTAWWSEADPEYFN